MRTRPTPDGELARVAGMIGDPTRAAMLGALLGGEALPAANLLAARVSRLRQRRRTWREGQGQRLRP